MNIEGSVIVGITHNLPRVIDASQADITRVEVGSEGFIPTPSGPVMKDWELIKRIFAEIPTTWPAPLMP